MHRIDENRILNYVKKHTTFKKWLAFALCISLLTGTFTLYLMNKPATAMTEESSESVGLVLETADSEFEQSVIQQTLSGGNSNDDCTDSEGALLSTGTDESKNGRQSGDGTSDGSSASPSSDTEGIKNGSSSGDDTSSEDSTLPSSDAEGVMNGSQSSTDSSKDISVSSSTASGIAATGNSSTGASGEATVADKSSTGASAASDQAATGKSSTDASAASDQASTVKSSTDASDQASTVKSSTDASDLASTGKPSTGASTAASIDASSLNLSSTEGTSKTDSAVHSAATTDITEFTYEDEEVVVKAVTTSAGVLPEGTSLKVTAVDKNTDGYNYDAYMEALNSNAEEIENNTSVAKIDDPTSKDADSKEESDKSEKKFDESNTLLYDIAFICDEKEFQPADGAVTVSLEFKQNKLSNDLSVTNKDDVTVVHLPIKDEVKEEIEVETTEQATEIKADDVEVIALKDSTAEVGAEEKVEFSANDFSVFAVVRTVIEKNVLASDGHNYHITVTCGEDSLIPRDADITVSELNGDEYKDYVGRTCASMNASGFDYARIFDITIVDSNGAKIQPAAPVDVSVTLLDATDNAKPYSVVHFEGEGAEESPSLVNAVSKGNAVSFSAESFSAYAIVQGPKPLDDAWKKVTGIDELISADGKGNSSKRFYIGHVNGYYFGNTLLKTNEKNQIRVGIAKTTPAQSTPPETAAPYYFESAGESGDQVITYCIGEDGKEQYIYNEANNSLSFTNDKEKATPFTVTVDDNGVFRFHNGEWYWNMQGGDKGTRFCSYTDANDPNACMNVWYFDNITDEPYGLDGKSYGLMNWAGGVAGKAMMASASAGKLEAKSLTVMSTADNSDKLFVPNESDISMWTFKWISDDIYSISTNTTDGDKYLKISSEGLEIVNETTQIQVIPGAGINKGEICLKSGGNILTYSGTVEGGFSTGGNAGNEWLRLVEISELTKDYFLTYTAKKAGVSDPKITNGSKVIVYTRSWDEDRKKYNYYAVRSDGKLIPVYESGDTIEWLSTQLNDMLWNFIEHYWEGTTDPNYYYDLYSQHSKKYIAPQITGNQLLSETRIGINLNGRRDGQYYSPILAWDAKEYQYVGLKVEDGQIVICPKSEAMDFYFAVIEDLNVDDTLTEVETVDNSLYGIKMKIVDFDTRKWMSDYLGNNDGGIGATLHQGLLTTDLKSNGYPDAKGGSLLGMFANAKDVNHLFIQSTYDETGYFTFDSAQNYATLKGKTEGDFTVYKQLGSYDSLDDRSTLKHGQFFPFNDLKPGVFSSFENLYAPMYIASAKGCIELPDSDPRKYEQLYLVEHDNDKVNTYFGLELEASFMQTPSGLDEWGHDIIFEFTGDDDFWLYVDDELVIDLGGIHSAVPGNVNFRTGDVNVNGKSTTLKALFEENYKKRNISDASIAEKIDTKFILNSEGNYVFQDDTIHTMRIFYMERGASASNLHMRFNLTAVKKNTVQLTKELKLGNVDEKKIAGNILAKFPYQILYKKADQDQEYHLTNSVPDSTQNEDYVTYKDSIKPVEYKQSATIGGKEYTDVFFIEPGKTADISFPDGVTEYKVVECGVDTDMFSSVSVNDKTVEGTSVEGSDNHKDFEIDYAAMDKRPRVKYTNEIKEDALGTLTITKRLYAEDGRTEITDDNTPFTFRIYLTSEFDTLDVANMQTYYVKDKDGFYCRWDSAQEKFVRIRDGIKDFSDLTSAERTNSGIAFTTSIYGTIDNVRAGYTIEFRDLLIGTNYRVEERPVEIPDGYSFMRYDNYDTNNAQIIERGSSGIQGVQGNIVHATGANVDICNMKGFGLRLNKIWQDAGYMTGRDPVYFALFTVSEAENAAGAAEGGNLCPVPESVRQLTFDNKEQTIYWHYNKLPVQGTAGVNDYLIREVKVSGSNISVSADGVVSGYETLEPIVEGETITLKGTQKGGDEKDFTYTVHYGAEKLLSSDGTNVRVYEVTNKRTGIVIKKEDWNNNPLQGAVFTLKDESGNEVGTFTSDETGLITTAYLSNGTYYLTETDAPKTYRGLDSSMTIIVDGDQITATYHDKSYDELLRDGMEPPFKLTQAEGDSPATLIVRNRKFSFEAVKVDKDTEAPISGVTFALHEQKTVDGVTGVEVTPMEGYDSLMTNENGIIPRIDTSLPVGTYELREMNTPPGYAKPGGYIRFTISPNGTITLVSCPDDVSLTENVEEDGTLKYVLKVPNTPVRKVSFKKVDVGNTGKALKGAVFDLYGTDDKGKRLENPLYQGLISDTNGLLAYKLGDNSYITQFELPGGTYHLVETKAPDGYIIKEAAVVVTVDTKSDDSVTYDEGTSLSSNGKGDGKSYDSQTKLYTLLVTNSTGYMLPATGGPGTKLLYIIGSMMILLAGASMLLWHRRLKKK